MIANYHTHTWRCKHCVGDDRQFVEEAIKGGLKILGFADHVPYVYENGFVSSVRMKPSEADEYFHTLSSLREEYKKDIKIYIGFEAEYIPVLMKTQDDFLRDYPLDYMIMGQHYSLPEYEAKHYMRGTESCELAEYVDMVIEGLSSGRYRYLAHPDMPKVKEKDERFTEEFTRLCKFLKENDIPFETNMLGYVMKRNYPSDEFMRIAASVGAKTIIGCDAHNPVFLSDRENHSAVRRYAESFGLEIIDILPGLS